MDAGNARPTRHSPAAFGASRAASPSLLNLARACCQLERFDEAQRCLARAQAADPQGNAQYAWPAERGGSGVQGGRAAARPAPEDE
jgi:hypothetical protein